jgi:CubicO group peptidase (beta-lactamase class C family)
MTAARCALLALVVLPFAQEQDPDLNARLVSIARSAVDDALLPGLSVQMTWGVDTVLARGFGYSHVARAQKESAELVRALDPALEPMIAVAALRLAAQGKLDLSVPIVEHFPELAPRASEVRFEQLLTHTSGLPGFGDFARARGKAPDAAGVVAWTAERPLDADPGTCFAPSDTDTVLAGLIVTKVAGSSLPDALRDLVFEPAGMDRTSFATTAETIEAGCRESHDELGRDLVRVSLGLPPLVSTLGDVTGFVRALAIRELLDEDGWRRLAAPVSVQGGEAPFARGFARASLDGHEALAFGSVEGTSVYVSWYPDLDLVVALATANETTLLPAIERRLVRAMLDLPEPGVLDLPLSREARAGYLGGYYLGCNRVEIQEGDERLRFAPADTPSYRLLHQGGHRFVSERDPDVRFEFRFDSGRAIEFVMTEHGMQSTAKRMD